MTNENDNPLDLPAIEGTQVSPAVAVASVALSLSLKYLDSTVIKDGTMYQQMKLEGKVIKDIDLRNVFEVAKQFEAHLMSAPGRLADMIFDAVTEGVKEEEEKGLKLTHPVHPGEIINDEILVPAGKTPKEAADMMHVSHDRLQAVIDGREVVSTLLAAKIESTFNYPAQTLLSMQETYDAYKDILKQDAHPQE